jgi:hypothetical protein
MKQLDDGIGDTLVSALKASAAWGKQVDDVAGVIPRFKSAV